MNFGAGEDERALQHQLIEEKLRLLSRAKVAAKGALAVGLALGQGFGRGLRRRGKAQGAMIPVGFQQGAEFPAFDYGNHHVRPNRLDEMRL